MIEIIKIEIKSPSEESARGCTSGVHFGGDFSAFIFASFLPIFVYQQGPAASVDKGLF